MQELYDSSSHLMHAEVMPRCRVSVRYDLMGNFIYSIVALPQSIYSRKVFLRTQKFFVDLFKAEMRVSSVEIFEGQIALAYFCLQGKSLPPKVDLTEIEREIDDILMDWDNLFLKALKEKYGGRARELHKMYMPEQVYKNSFSPTEALVDLEKVLLGRDDVKFYKDENDKRLGLRVHFYLTQRNLTLNQAVEYLAQIGFQALKEDFYRLGSERNPSFFVHVFRIKPERSVQNLEKLFHVLENALRDIVSGKSHKFKELNKLVLYARLSWRQVFLVKAYAAYMKQISYPFGAEVLAQVLGKNSEVTNLVLKFFEARFDPTVRREEEKEALENALRAVVLLKDALHDRVLRAFISMVQATTRTNFYCGDSSCLILKFLNEKIPFCPKPAPYIEAFVFGEHVEGCHLRDSIISRGGIRWSDRKQDYRQEALELQQTQKVKNAVIIPSGAKGAFYTDGIPGFGERDVGREAYRVFISTLLEVTDNLDSSRKVVHPRDVVVHDRDDFYLAVAADKGTATFSDLANQIAQEKGFWMGDAFASGGGNGYDHKAMGITANGAWVSVMHHVHREDLLKKGDFTAVGCGDMSGDVFGNGMLIDKNMKLLAAFDYRDIFLDPSPDPEVSWKERKRLFDLPHSSWQDYDSALISEGGGVFSRKTKSIPISPEVRKALSVDERIKECSPQNLIRFILKAKVALLWFGGIGTYVKSSSENHEEVKDNANVSTRVDGKDLRCTIVGEGANLAMTQQGRVEAALHGVILNTDFIDNMGGVACSDQEVNLKLLLGKEVGKKITLSERNKILQPLSGSSGGAGAAEQQEAKLCHQHGSRDVQAGHDFGARLAPASGH